MTIIDPRCPDCDATVTVEENSEAGMRLTVDHDPTCPWLAAREQGAGGFAMFSVFVLHKRRDP